MDQGLIAEISREALYTLLQVSMPILVVALLIGLSISLFQALTQIQETTLTFVPKILAVYIGLIFIGPYMLSKMELFVNHIIQYILR
ncbi:MAG TPA: flagellar biosynthesis protein FliQ [Candidatus Megaira endosymbiont of Hartmannula sinica]|nr:flagellar biosynthesis protein FliQ [Candidatus Megaera endosymbiont of Hartmannula sinica]